MRNESFIAGFTLFEGLDAIGIQGVLSVTGLVAFRECLEVSRFNCSYSGFWGVIGLGDIIGNLVSLKTADDLNSLEPDSKWIPPLTAKASRDDIIHVNDGSLTGPAANYSYCGLS